MASHFASEGLSQIRRQETSLGFCFSEVFLTAGHSSGILRLWARPICWGRTGRGRNNLCYCRPVTVARTAALVKEFGHEQRPRSNGVPPRPVLGRTLANVETSDAPCSDSYRLLKLTKNRSIKLVGHLNDHSARPRSTTRLNRINGFDSEVDFENLAPVNALRASLKVEMENRSRACASNAGSVRF